MHWAELLVLLDDVLQLTELVKLHVERIDHFAALRALVVFFVDLRVCVVQRPVFLFADVMLLAVKMLQALLFVIGEVRISHVLL